MILSVEGSILQLVTDSNTIHSGYIEMDSERPSMLYLAQSDGTWLQDLNLTKEAKIKETKQVSYDHMAVYVEAMGENAIPNLLKQMLAQGMATAPNTSSNLDKCVDIWSYFLTQQAAINAMTTVAEVEAYDPVNDAGWPY